MTAIPSLSTRPIAAIALDLAGGALGFALFAQHHLQMIPCPLCLIERWPYRIAIVGSALALVLPPKFARILLWACVGLFAASVALAFFHAGVEFHWWKSPLPECNAPDLRGLSMADRLAAMPDKPSKQCEDPDYLISFLPISFVQMAFLYALFGTVLTALLLQKGRRA